MDPYNGQFRHWQAVVLDKSNQTVVSFTSHLVKELWPDRADELNRMEYTAASDAKRSRGKASRVAGTKTDVPKVVELEPVDLMDQDDDDEEEAGGISSSHTVKGIPHGPSSAAVTTVGAAKRGRVTKSKFILNTAVIVQFLLLLVLLLLT